MKTEKEIYEFDSESCSHKEKEEPHECPYRSELYDDFTLCTCCEKCTDQCSDDI